MSERFKGVVTTLEKEESTLEAELAKLQAKVTEKESELQSVQGAIRELSGKPPQKKIKRTSVGRKPSATQQDVIATVAEVLKEKGVVEQDDLKELVEKSIVESGKSRMAFALRFEEAIADKQFIETPGGYRLASEVSEQKEVA